MPFDFILLQSILEDIESDFDVGHRPYRRLRDSQMSRYLISLVEREHIVPGKTNTSSRGTNLLHSLSDDQLFDLLQLAEEDLSIEAEKQREVEEALGISDEEDERRSRITRRYEELREKSIEAEARGIVRNLRRKISPSDEDLLDQVWEEFRDEVLVPLSDES